MTYLPSNARTRSLAVTGTLRPAMVPSLARLFVVVVVDLVAIWLAFWLAYLLRYRYEVGGQVFAFNQHTFPEFYGRIALFSALCLSIFLVRGVYRRSSWMSLLDEMGLVAGSLTIAMGGWILTAYLSQFSPSRLLIVYAWALSLGLLFLVRVARRQLQEALWTRDIGVRQVLIVGSGTSGRRLMQILLATPSMGIRVAGYVDGGIGRGSLTAGTERGVMRAQRLGSLDDIPSILDRTRVDEVILALPSERYGRVFEIANLCRSAGVPFRVVPDLLQLSLDRVQLEEISGVPILSVREASIRGANAIVKRGADIIGAFILLLLLSMPMTVAALQLRRTEENRILRRRTMVGRCGVPFIQLRFSTGGNSGEMTTPPSWIQRSRLDGAPQLLNVLRGEMSLVGPRAQPLKQLAEYQSWQRQRLLISPGMTGLWFSNGRTDLTFDEMVRLDLFYAEHWSVWLDLKILLRSLVALLRGRSHI